MYKNPYKNWDNTTEWLRGNFHTHAGTGPNTCGAYDLEEVIQMYKEAGYGVLAISNHDIFTDTTALAEKYGLVMLNGIEYSQAEHMLCLNINDVIFAPHQEAIDMTKAQGGFTILNHPNWDTGTPFHWKREDIDKLTGYIGIEVFNTVIQRLKGTGVASDVWDYLLSQGKLVYGFGNDDFHRWYDFSKSFCLFGLNSHDQNGLLDAVNEGRFVTSTGLTLTAFTFENNTLSLSASTLNGFVGTIEYRFIGKDGKLLKTQHSGNGAQYQLKGDELYVRVEAVNSFGAMLWTQPVYDDAKMRRV